MLARTGARSESAATAPRRRPQSSLFAVVVIAAAVAASGCTKQNPAYCDMEIDCPNGLPCDLEINSCPGGCSDSGDCDSSLDPICDPAGMCRGCQSPDECIAKDPNAPVCDSSGQCVGCADNSDCPDSSPVCNPSTGACGDCESEADCSDRPPNTICSDGGCVECVTQTECTLATEPVCDDGSCRGCADHDECAGEVCLDDGGCPEAASIIHVDRAFLGSPPCGVGGDMPCGDLRGAILTMEMLPPPAPRIVLVEPGTYPSRFVIDGDAIAGDDPIVIRAKPGSIYTGTTPNALPDRLRVLKGAAVTIDGLTITGSTTEDGAVCSEGAVLRLRSLPALEGHRIGVLADGCALVEVSRSLLRNNFHHAIRITASEFAIGNNIIVENGDSSVFLSAVDISAPSAGRREFSFNTVGGNTAGAGVVAGVSCASSSSLALHSNIIYGNESGEMARLEDQINSGASACSHVFSAIQEIARGDGNTPDDPMLDGQFRLMPGSPCIDAADPQAPEQLDIDGDDRPLGPGPDIGADEFLQ